MPFRRLIPALVLSAMPLCAAPPFPDASTLPSHPGLPDPLVALDGTRIRTAEEWHSRRRPELKALVQHYMYGTLPPRPGRIEFETVATHDDFLGGRGVLKLVRIGFGDPKAPVIDLMVVVPRGRPERLPVFLAMNFCGNHAVSEDPRIPLTRGWLYDSCKGCRDHHATEASRGGQQQDWPIGEILERGYAFATFCSTDIDSDRKDVSDGVYAWLAGRASAPNPAADRGTIAAWAWGFHRCVDYLVQDPSIDPGRIAAVGHSRNGKTALLAAAFDERIALAIPHQAGCGGTAPSRGTVGESVKRINDVFPHWFGPGFKAFNEDPSRLPFDQNGLLALVAPRPVLFGNAEEDQWANPRGQFEVLKAAEPAYELLGGGRCDASEPPPNDRLVASRLGYFIRAGKHSMTAGDWRVFLEFADRHLRPGR